MSHVDEGALHAYLDGALDEYPAPEATHIRDHLETCQQCAIRLEAQRRVRQEASAILDLAVPHVEVPSFEELRAYVKATRPPRAHKSVRLYRLGWAASVVLAVGAGWLVRDGQLPSSATAGGAELVVPVAPAAEGAGPADLAADRDAPAERESAGAEQRFSAIRGALADDEAGAAPARQEAARSIVGTEAAPLGSNASTTAGQPETAKATEALPDAAAPGAEPAPADVVAFRDEADANVAVGIDSTADSYSQVLDEVVTTGVAGRAAATPPVAEPAGIALAPVSQLGAPGDTSPARVGGGRAVTPEPSAAEPDRRRADAAPVSARMQLGPTTSLDRPSLEEGSELDEIEWTIVPGLEVVSYANLAEGTAPTGVRVVQILPDGGLLDVYHLPEGVEPTALPALEPGRNEVRAVRGGQWVVLRAAVDRAALEELLARMDPPR